MKPTVSRIVHYVSAGSADGSYPSVCRAAIVTELCDNPDGIDPETGTLCVSLAVLNPEGMHFRQHVPQAEPIQMPMTWHWPEREEVFFDDLASKSLKVAIDLAGDANVIQRVKDGLRGIDEAREELKKSPWGGEDDGHEGDPA